MCFIVICTKNHVIYGHCSLCLFFCFSLFLSFKCNWLPLSTKICIFYSARTIYTIRLSKLLKFSFGHFLAVFLSFIDCILVNSHFFCFVLFHSIPFRPILSQNDTNIYCCRNQMCPYEMAWSQLSFDWVFYHLKWLTKIKLNEQFQRTNGGGLVAMVVVIFVQPNAGHILLWQHWIEREKAALRCFFLSLSSFIPRRFPSFMLRYSIMSTAFDLYVPRNKSKLINKIDLQWTSVFIDHILRVREERDREFNKTTNTHVQGESDHINDKYFSLMIFMCSHKI